MWLINTKTLLLEFISNPGLHRYAILSHTWENEEVSFQEMANLKEARRRKGFAKIKKTCELARKRSPPLPYAWVDTCCIDKKSSAELTEAINSMFSWYKKADVCFVFLSDFPAHRAEVLDPLLHRCRWFTRGWTLQELIAPKLVEFYDSEWNYHRTKSERIDEIADITGVNLNVLNDSDALSTVPVGVRMSWAAGRETTREEDKAYCLMGIFGVNMPMIYGEGENAFMRLQKQIMEDTNDMTLFAWKSHSSDQKYRGILPRSPSEFKACRGLMTTANVSSFGVNTDYMLTNNGLRIHTCLMKDQTNTQVSDYILNLGCLDDKPGVGSKMIGIRLTKTPNGFVRRLPDQFYYADDDAAWAGKESTTYIRREVSSQESELLESKLDRNIKVTFDLPPGLDLKSLDVQPSTLWDQYNLAFMLGNDVDLVGFLSIGLENKTTGTQMHFAIICNLYGAYDAKYVAKSIRQPRVRRALVYSEIQDKDVFGLVNEHAKDVNSCVLVPPQLRKTCSRLYDQTSTPSQDLEIECGQHARVHAKLQILPKELKVCFTEILEGS